MYFKTGRHRDKNKIRNKIKGIKGAGKIINEKYGSTMLLGEKKKQRNLDN